MWTFTNCFGKQPMVNHYLSIDYTRFSGIIGTMSSDSNVYVCLMCTNTITSFCHVCSQHLTLPSTSLPIPFPSCTTLLAMAYKKCLAVFLLALCLIATNAAPVPENLAPSPSPVDTPVQFNVGDAINNEIHKASRTFRISTTAVIAICIGCAVAVILAICCCLCCCCGCLK